MQTIELEKIFEQTKGMFPKVPYFVDTEIGKVRLNLSIIINQAEVGAEFVDTEKDITIKSPIYIIDETSPSKVMETVNDSVSDVVNFYKEKFGE